MMSYYYCFTLTSLDEVGLDTSEDTMVLEAVGFETTEDTEISDVVSFETTKEIVAMGMLNVTNEDMQDPGVTSVMELKEKLRKPEAFANISLTFLLLVSIKRSCL